MQINKQTKRINVNDCGLRQALIENLFELVDKVEAQVELRNQVLSFLICIGFLRQGGPGGGGFFNQHQGLITASAGA